MTIVREFSVALFGFIGSVLGLNPADCPVEWRGFDQGFVYVCESTVPPARSRRR